MITGSPLFFYSEAIYVTTMQDNENKTKIYIMFWEYRLKLFTLGLAIRKVSRSFQWKRRSGHNDAGISRASFQKARHPRCPVEKRRSINLETRPRPRSRC